MTVGSIAVRGRNWHTHRERRAAFWAATKSQSENGLFLVNRTARSGIVRNENRPMIDRCFAPCGADDVARVGKGSESYVFR